MKSDIKIFASVIDERSKNQIDEIIDAYPYSSESVRIMPDVHAGYGCVIGFTSTTTQRRVNPHLVGNDIGCGMTIVKLGKIDIDYKNLDSFIDSISKYGTNSDVTFDDLRYDFISSCDKLASALRCDVPDNELAKIIDTLGTLGGGNHFIEIDKSKDGDLYLIIHSGSRRLGNYVYKYYVSKNFDAIKKAKSEIIKSMIEEMKRNGLHSQIEKRIKEINTNDKSINEDILHESLLHDYLHDMSISVEFAKQNRSFIAMSICKYLGVNIDDSSIEHCVHNYIDHNGIIRKGACSAYKDQRVVIPINMRDGVIIGHGLGNPDWNFSAPHGAGRMMSRSEARQKLSIDDLHKSMDGINTWSICDGVIDESPSAYKKLEDILPWLSETVAMEDVLKPIYNYKIVE